ncbi:MAG: TRAP transporter TatT component family protein [Burkholderiales bacterium]
MNLTPQKLQLGDRSYIALARGILLAAALVLAACSPRQLILDGVAEQLAGQGQASEEDLVLAREASAFYLKLSESLLRRSPGNLKLTEAVAGGYSRYAYAFVATEAERIESRDAKAAQKLRERAARLYLRAHRHAMAALEQRSPGFAKALASNNPSLWPRLADEHIGVAYWAAASWGGFISLSKDDPDAVADLPLAVRLAHLAWEKQPNHGNGALASLMGAFESARPGGSRERATGYFDQAIAAGGGKNAAAYVAKAEGVALPALDRAGFEALLRQALAVSGARRDLENEVMRERAQWLLDTADDLF